VSNLDLLIGSLRQFFNDHYKKDEPYPLFCSQIATLLTEFDRIKGQSESLRKEVKYYEARERAEQEVMRRAREKLDHFGLSATGM
jgi:hypothetical protein